MTLFDVIVLLFVGFAAIGGFMRGLVQEVLSLAAWILAAFAVYYLHDLLTEALRSVYNAEPATPLLAFVLLLLIPYASMRIIASNAGEASRSSILGPIDRLLGFGFGAVKGALIVIFAFSIVVLGFDTVWGAKGRPDWVTQARTYPAADAFSRQLVQMISARRSRLEGEAEAEEAANSDG
ncbi:CvpA family protein [Erythrobacter crassostreae]|uniref:CvpA family protein n=1 Tax=Erythrobacter crassostreae TaxID=2828328 RepID=A0A9X1JNS3_9SPHN|nr:CvpA family protein [Erythrobacter crassostrea]MBV7260003.1 CvpA family protein [Erythrobacter crassostrea]